MNPDADRLDDLQDELDGKAIARAEEWDDNDLPEFWD